jgi:1,4-dihydroxy-2-naphthoate octaprenyltransferase
MSRSYIWSVVIVVCLAGAFLTAMIFGLLQATILTLVMTPVLLAAATVFHKARVARRKRKIIKKMVEAATTGEGRPGNAMKHAAE